MPFNDFFFIFKLTESGPAGHSGHSAASLAMVEEAGLASVTIRHQLTAEHHAAEITQNHKRAMLGRVQVNVFARLSKEILRKSRLTFFNVKANTTKLGDFS